MLIAEELEADPATASCGSRRAACRCFMPTRSRPVATGGSTSIAAFYGCSGVGAMHRWLPASQRRAIDASSCRRKRAVVHSASNQSLTYGDLAAKINAPDAGEGRAEAIRRHFKIIESSPKREIRQQDDWPGAQQEHRLRAVGDEDCRGPRLARSLRGKLAGMDEKAALAVTGVRKVVQFR